MKNSRYAFFHHRLYFFTAFIIALLLGLHASAAEKIKWTTDKFNGSKMAKIQLSYFGQVAFGQFTKIELCGLAPSMHYYIRVEYTYKEWLFIPEGDSLFIKADGEMIALSGNGSASSRDTYDDDPYHVSKQSNTIRIREVAFYPITVEQIKKLSLSKSIQYRVVGQHGTVTSGAYTNREVKVFVDEAMAVFESSKASATQQQ